MAKDTHDFKEHLYTIDKRGNRLWVYPHIVSGFFRKKRAVVALFLICFYILTPWITIGSDQAIFLDISNRRFIFFGLTFWASDSEFLVMVLGGLGISLFFFSALFGRVWCGWACPETVFLEFIFRPIEAFFEGGPNDRRKLDAAPWDFQKIFKKVGKYFSFAVFSWILASTSLAYFLGRTPLWHMMLDGPLDHMPMFTLTLAMMAFLLFQFGWFREQFCTVVCPYARFQSVLLDPHSLVVGYDSKRGEPRGKNSEGDCIDCGLCVRVCPTGIDIRNGLQLECVQCTACIDACDSIMEKIGKPKGLVRYASEERLKGNTTKILRPRIVVYALMITGYLVLFTYSLITKDSAEVRILRQPGEAPFQIVAPGIIDNHFNIHISNKSNQVDSFSVIGSSDERVKVITPIQEMKVPAGSLKDLPVFLQFPGSILEHGTKKITLYVKSMNGYKGSQEIALSGPDT